MAKSDTDKIFKMITVPLRAEQHGFIAEEARREERPLAQMCRVLIREAIAVRQKNRDVVQA